MIGMENIQNNRIVTIGRAYDCNIVVPKEFMRVSRHHAEIKIVQKRLVLADTSRNGTMVNNRTLRGTSNFIKEGDVIRCANEYEVSWDDIARYFPEFAPNHKPKIVDPIDGDDMPEPADPTPQPGNEDPKAPINKNWETEMWNEINRFKREVPDESVGRVLYASLSSEVAVKIEHYNEMESKLSALLHRLSELSMNWRGKTKDDFQTKIRLMTAIQGLVDDFHTAHPLELGDYYETCGSTHPMWKELHKQSHNSPLSNTYIARSTTNYPIFDDCVKVDKQEFMPFLDTRNVIAYYNQETKNSCFRFVNTLISRLLISSQSGKIFVNIVDAQDMEGTSDLFKTLNKSVFIYSREGEISQMLEKKSRYVENIIQNLLVHPYYNIGEYNVGKSNPESYHLIVIKAFPIGISAASQLLLKQIIKNGLRAGVQVVLLVDTDEMASSLNLQKQFEIFEIEKLKKYLQSYDFTKSIYPFTHPTISQNIKFDDFSIELIKRIVQFINLSFENKPEEVISLSSFMPKKDNWWKHYSSNMIEVPFGVSEEKELIKLSITQQSGQNSVVVIGVPGSGKSVFLHVLIANAMLHYSPKELQMYLLDFSGVEFDVYARHKLPHARVIAPEAEREFGLSVLREVFEEGTRRMNLCRENGVTNIVELKQKNPDIVVPRLLVIIDEFQKIFEIENDKISHEANAKIHAIIQEYRKFGINLILATQKLPAKSIVPYDLIANRVVFKSDPNDFNNLIRWPHSIPQPRLLTGNCIYNNESGFEMSNYITRSFFINASGELENLIDEVAAFGKAHPEMMDKHELRTFRSEELPEFTNRILSDRHIEHQDAPREIGVYMGESIAISQCHVYVPLTKDSNNNILIIGGRPDVAKGIAYHTLLSEVAGHNEKTCNVIMMNFMMEDDPMRNLFQSDMFAAISNFCNMQEAHSTEDVKDFLQFVKEEVIDARKNDPSLPLTHFFINIFEFQRARMFDGAGSRGDMQSDCARLLEYIMKNGPMVGVFTILQVDNLANLSRLGYGAQNMFCHRIALQMSEQDSDKIVGNSAANRLLVFNRPSSNFRGLYYNNINNSITKFKPYRYGISN